MSFTVLGTILQPIYHSHAALVMLCVRAAPSPRAISPPAQPPALTEGQGRAFIPRAHNVLFLTVLVASRILIGDSGIWI